MEPFFIYGGQTTKLKSQALFYRGGIMASDEEAAKQRPVDRICDVGIAPLLCEFFGSFLFQFFAGCAVVGAKSLTSAALSLGFTLMV